MKKAAMFLVAAVFLIGSATAADTVYQDQMTLTVKDNGDCSLSINDSANKEYTIAFGTLNSGVPARDLLSRLSPARKIGYAIPSKTIVLNKVILGDAALREIPPDNGFRSPRKKGNDPIHPYGLDPKFYDPQYDRTYSAQVTVISTFNASQVAQINGRSYKINPGTNNLTVSLLNTHTITLDQNSVNLDTVVVPETQPRRAYGRSPEIVGAWKYL